MRGVRGVEGEALVAAADVLLCCCRIVVTTLEQR